MVDDDDDDDDLPDSGESVTFMELVLNSHHQ
jgi:hypothetical protein